MGMRLVTSSLTGSIHTSSPGLLPSIETRMNSPESGAAMPCGCGPTSSVLMILLVATSTMVTSLPALLVMYSFCWRDGESCARATIEKQSTISSEGIRHIFTLHLSSQHLTQRREGAKKNQLSPPSSRRDLLVLCLVTNAFQNFFFSSTSFLRRWNHKVPHPLGMAAFAPPVAEMEERCPFNVDVFRNVCLCVGEAFFYMCKLFFDVPSFLLVHLRPHMPY